MSLTYLSFLKFNFTFCSMLFVGGLPFPLSWLHSGTSPTAADAPDGLLAGGAASAVLQVSRGWPPSGWRPVVPLLLPVLLPLFPGSTWIPLNLWLYGIQRLYFPPGYRHGRGLLTCVFISRKTLIASQLRSYQTAFLQLLVKTVTAFFSLHWERSICSHVPFSLCGSFLHQ